MDSKKTLTIAWVVIVLAWGVDFFTVYNGGKSSISSFAGIATLWIMWETRKYIKAHNVKLSEMVVGAMYFISFLWYAVLHLYVAATMYAIHGFWLGTLALFAVGGSPLFVTVLVIIRAGWDNWFVAVSLSCYGFMVVSWLVDSFVEWLAERRETE